MPRGELIGGEGRDNLTGGSGADRLVGGGGIDRIIGGRGDDAVTMGLDSDQFTWNVGDGNDRVDGDGGTDTLLMNGSEGNDIVIASAAVGARAVVSMASPPFGSVDYSGIEQLKVEPAGGSDDVEVGELAGTAVTQVRLNLDPTTSTALDHVFVLLGNQPQRVRVSGSPATGVTVFGTAVPVVTRGAELLHVTGGTGNDVLDASGLATGTIDPLVMFGGQGDLTGNDTLIGSPGNDLLFGGDGDDRLEGRGGDDTLDGGTGTNVIIP